MSDRLFKAAKKVKSVSVFSNGQVHQSAVDFDEIEDMLEFASALKAFLKAQDVKAVEVSSEERKVVPLTPKPRNPQPEQARDE